MTNKNKKMTSEPNNDEYINDNNLPEYDNHWMESMDLW